MRVSTLPFTGPAAVPSAATPAGRGPLQQLARLLRSLAAVALALLVSVSLAACSNAQARPPALSADDIALITRQAEGFLSARNRLPELAGLVNSRNWVFTRNLIHGPMQEVGREMSYINQHLLPSERAEADKRAQRLKTAFAELDEAARLQDAEALRKAYIKVASGFGLYAQVLPQQVQEALKQV
jgi:photosystem II protein PsbQ